MTVFELMAKLVLDKSEYEAGLDDAEGEAQTFGQTLKTALGTAGNVAGTAFKGIAAGAGKLTTTLFNGINELADYGDGVDKASQKLGISAEAYQEWDAVLQHSGTSMAAMTGTFKTLSNVAQGASDEQIDALNRLGMSLDDVASMSTEDLFGAIVTSLQDMGEGTERSYIATQLLGRGATELGALLNTSAEDTRAMQDRVHELGGVLDDVGVKNAARFKDEMQDMQTAIQGAGRNIMESFLPAFSDAIAFVTDFATSDIFKDIASKVSDIFQHIVDFMTDTLMPAFERVWPALSGLIDNFLGLFESLMPILEPIFSFIVDTVSYVVIPVLSDVVDSISTVVKIVTGDFSANVKDMVQAEQDLADAHDRLLDANDRLINATDRLEKAQDRLRDVEEKVGISGETLFQMVEDGMILYEYMTDDQKELYKAYMDNVKAEEELTAATDNLTQAKEDEKIASWEVARAAAEEGDAIEEYCDKVIEAFENGEISADQARTLIEEAMTGMSLSAESAFLQRIPDAIKNGLDPVKYETQASLVKKVFDDLWPKIEQGAIDMANWVQTNVIDPVNTWFADLCTSIANAFSGAWDAITSVFKNAASWFQTNVIDPIAQAWSSLIALFGGGSGESKLDAFTSKQKTPDSTKNKNFPHLAGGGILQKGEIGILEGDGAEAVVPLDQNERWIKAVSSDMLQSLKTSNESLGGGNSVSNSVVINVYAAEGQDEKAVADEVDRRLWESLNSKDMVYA